MPSSTWGRWVYALKPASWPKLLVPTLFGQVLGAVSVGGLDASAMAWGLGFTLCGLGFIVLLNDWGDRRVDSLQRSMFPDGCSPKTIPDRILSSSSVGVAGLCFGVLTLGCAVGAEEVLGRRWAFEAGLACMVVFTAYTLPPFKLNYRGGGELLEMLGVGVALPVYNIYLQAGSIALGLWPWIAGFSFLSLGSGIASGLSDELSDKEGGKRTLASMFGNRVARTLTETSLLVGVGIWVFGAILAPRALPPWAVAPAVAIVLWRFVEMRRVSPSAVTNAFAAQGRYKRFLHAGIWHSSTVAALLLWLALVIE